MGSVPAEDTRRVGAGGGPKKFRSPTAVIIWWIWLLFAVGNLVDLAVQGRDHTSLVAAAILVLATGVAYVTALRPRIIADDAGITVRNPLRDYHIGWAWVTKINLADLLRVHCDWSSQAGAAPGTKQYTKVISSWAVHYSRRRQLAAEARARRPNARLGTRRSFGLATYGGNPESGAGHGTGYGRAPDPVPAAEAEAEKIVKVLSEYATAARAETIWAGGTADISGAGQAGRTAGDDAADGPQALQHVREPGWLEPLTAAWSRSALAALIIPALILLVAWLV